MDERLIRALLAIMNLSPDKPPECSWFAEIVEVGEFGKSTGIEQRMVFWLLKDGSAHDTSQLISS